MENLNRDITEICRRLETDMFLTASERVLLLSKIEDLVEKRERARKILEKPNKEE